MKIYLQELSEEPKELHFSEQDEWLREAIAETQEFQDESQKNSPQQGSSAPCSVDLELRKLQHVVFLKGKLDVQVSLYCSRCANAFDQPLASQFQCMFTRDPALHRKDSNAGIAYSEPTGSSEEDLDIAFLEKDYIELSDVLKEQIYLKIPFQPLCDENCKGICAVCGQDQNIQPCQCHRLKKTALANALKDFLNSN